MFLYIPKYLMGSLVYIPRYRLYFVIASYEHKYFQIRAREKVKENDYGLSFQKHCKVDIESSEVL